MLLILSSVFLLLFSPVLSTNTQPYDVHWLSGTTSIEREMQSSRKNLDIYCYPGTYRSFLSLWQTVKFTINIKTGNDDFYQYVGGSPEEVFTLYSENRYGWNVNLFQRKPSKTIHADLFNTTCMAISTKERHSIELQVIRIDIWRVLLMFLGITTIFLSQVLSGNPIFYYLCGILVGVFASFMVLVYYFSRLLPKKTFAYGIMIGGWTIGAYVFQQLWENFRSIMISYQNHVFWYTLVVGFLSFLVCYRIGPPTDVRSKNLVMWTLQLVGVAMIFFSSEHQQAAAAVIVFFMLLKYFPHSVTLSIKSMWHRKFPPKTKLLSTVEYYEQGARETKNALESLRQYCSSPDCAQWKLMLKLNDSKRFASFVDGESHLSDNEVLDYEAYAFSLDRNRRTAVFNSTTNDYDLSDDDSSQSEDDL